MFVEPKVFMIGATGVDMEAVLEYLQFVNAGEFAAAMKEAEKENLSPGEMLCSLYGKLCYASLSTGRNANITKVRGIADNLRGAFDHGHGSIFEHVSLNFVIANCSRVFTHELVRHRVGTAFSQTSGRYVRPVADQNGKLDIDFVIDPVLYPVMERIGAALQDIADAYIDCSIALGIATEQEAKHRADALRKRGIKSLPYTPAKLDFTRRKVLTSALRRILPNGQANEMGLTINLRTLRHCVMLRTSRHAEWEIRKVFAEVFNLVNAKFPLVFHGAKTRIVDKLPEVYGMKMQPYDMAIGDYDTYEILRELRTREDAPETVQNVVASLFGDGKTKTKKGK